MEMSKKQHHTAVLHLTKLIFRVILGQFGGSNQQLVGSFTTLYGEDMVLHVSLILS